LVKFPKNLKFLKKTSKIPIIHSATFSTILKNSKIPLIFSKIPKILTVLKNHKNPKIFKILEIPSTILIIPSYLLKARINPSVTNIPK
jgi:hypothetical protein